MATQQSPTSPELRSILSPINSHTPGPLRTRASLPLLENVATTSGTAARSSEGAQSPLSEAFQTFEVNSQSSSYPVPPLRQPQIPKSPSLARTPTPSRCCRADDRFIPSSASLYSFRMGSPANLLSPEERLLRHHSAAGSPTARPRRSQSPDSLIYSIGDTASVYGSEPVRRISAGAVGVFGIGVGAADTQSSFGPRGRGREIDGHIFTNKTSPEADSERHEFWLSAALGVDRSRRVLTFSPSGKGKGKEVSPEVKDKGLWENVVMKQNQLQSPQQTSKNPKRRVPSAPFRVLNAPGLRDDYYCSPIAYSPITHSLAVGLSGDVYNWSEASDAQSLDVWSSSHVTSLAFSCADGRNNILAIGRIDGSLSFWSPQERRPRLEQRHAAGIACVSWKPVVSVKPLGLQDRRSWFTEDILVGDEMGDVYIYAIEWIRAKRKHQGTGSAIITLLRKLNAHSQQICGLAWSTDGQQFATGGNDNVAYLFDTCEALSFGVLSETRGRALHSGERYCWPHGSAVKAIAFCPWQRSLLATGGGSNDRCIHFFHTFSGASLATINVSAQVTSLLWSRSNREIVATFGYANPEHPIRIAIFSWPECHQVAAIPWQEDMRALYAITYPGGPTTSEGSFSRGYTSREESDEDSIEEFLRCVEGRERGLDKRKRRAGSREGCIVVAASDETIRFHEVWDDSGRRVLQWQGILGGSDILEGLEGIDPEGTEVIR